MTDEDPPEDRSDGAPEPREATIGLLLAELGWIRSLARRIVLDDDLAEDIAQEVVEASLSKPPRHDGNLRGWLKSVTERIAHRRLRRQRATVLVPLDVDPSSDDDEPSSALQRLQVHRQLAEALLEVPEPYRSVLVARYFDGHEVPRIAKAHARSEDAVRQQITRGIQHLRKRIQRDLGPDWKAGLLLAAGLRPATVASAAVPALPILTLLAVILLGLSVWIWGIGAVLAGASAPEALPPTATAERAAVAAAPADDEAAGAAREVVVPPPDAPPGVLVVEVRDALGEPLHDLFVAAVTRSASGNESFYGDTTDQLGRAAFDRDDLLRDGEPHQVLVIPGDRFGVQRALDRSQGHLRIDLARGREVTGRLVLPDGRPPAVPVRVLLRDETVLEFGRESGRPNRFGVSTLRRGGLARLLGGTGLLLGISTETDRDGRFSFPGFSAEDWPGELTVAENYAVVGSSGGKVMKSHRHHGAVAFDLDETPLEITVVELPWIRGRIEFADGEPVGRATLSGSARIAGQIDPLSFVGRADASGRFAVGIREHPGEPVGIHDGAIQVEAATLRIERRGQMVPRTLEVEFAPNERVKDLGTVVVQRVEEVTVRVVDADGEPVPGARVDEGPGAVSASATTDRSGRASLGVLTPHSGFVVGASGFRVERHVPGRGRGTPADPFEIVLEPANRLDLSVQLDPEAHALLGGGSHLLASFRSPVPLFTGLEDGPVSARATAAHVKAGNPSAAGEGRFVLRSADEAPECWTTLFSVTPDIVVPTRIEDELGTLLAAEQPVRFPTAAGRVRARFDARGVAFTRVEIVADHFPRGKSTELVVRSPSGVHRRGLGGSMPLCYVATGEDVEATLSPPGHLVESWRFRLEPGVQRLEPKLQPAHSLTVTIEDAAGHQLAGSVRASGSPTRDVPPRRISLLDHLPDGPVELVAEVQGRRYVRTVDPSTVGPDGAYVLRVPQHTLVPLEIDARALEGLTDPVLRLTAVSTRSASRDAVPIPGEPLERPVLRRSGAVSPGEVLLLPGRYRVEVVAGATRRTVWSDTWDVPATALAEPRRILD